MEVVQAKKENIWGWPAVINFVLGGMGGGFYLLNNIFENYYGYSFVTAHAFVLKLFAPMLVLMGFAILSVEAGRPLRVVYAVRNIRSSWISVEIIAGVIFIAASIGDWVMPHVLMHLFASMAAVMLLLSHGYILYNARAVTAWNMPFVPPLFFFSSLVAGLGLVTLLLDPEKAAGVLYYFAGSAILLTLDLFLWVRYVAGDGGPVWRQTARTLRKPLVVLLAAGTGNIIPTLLLVFAGLEIWPATGLYMQGNMLFLSGIGIVAGSVLKKVCILRWTNYLRGMMLWHPGDRSLKAPTGESSCRV